jgi:hypothetical protein
VRTGLAGAYGQHRVEQQHALLGPGAEVAVPRRGDPEVVAQLLEDVAQRGRDRDALADAEAQAVRLALLVVRVLAEDQHPRRVGRAQPERTEQVGQRRVDRAGRILRVDERGQRRGGVEVEMGTDGVAPAGGQQLQEVEGHAGII